jgi:hypothetical protein
MRFQDREGNNINEKHETKDDKFFG